MQAVIAVLALGSGALPITAWAQEAVASGMDGALRLKPGAALEEALNPADKRLLPSFVRAQRMESQTDAISVLEGEAELRRRDLVIKADRIEFDKRSSEVKGSGDVLINRSGDRFVGPELQINIDTDKGHFSQPQFNLLKNEAVGDARRVDFLGKDHMAVQDGRYSTCPRVPGAAWMPAWLLRATTIDLDTEQDVGTARNGVLEFQGVPILAAPWLTFPLSDKRKSGVLPPNISLDSQSGMQVAVPYYLNLAPNYDLTLTPTLMSRRGVNLEGDFRHLQPGYGGRLRLAYMPSDRLRDRDRWAYSVQHGQSLGLGPWGPVNFRANLNRVGDDNYWRDFPRTETSLTSRLLPNDASLSWARGPWGFSAGAYQWQSLQDPTAPFTPPYDRLPSTTLLYSGVNQTLLGSPGWDISVLSNFTRFQRSSRVTGLKLKSGGDRSLMVADITHRWQAPGWYVQPRLRLNAAQYSANTNNAPTSTTAVLSGSRSRSVPTFSVDNGLLFERAANFLGQDYLQTLEPRAFFTWTPYRDQSDLPNYDSGSRDFNLASMFAENANSGYDRISDTRAITLGLSSRLLKPTDGSEVLRLGVAQRYLLADQNVTIPGRSPVTERISDATVAARLQWDPLWSLDTNVQFNPKSGKSVRTTIGGRYTPGPFKALSAAYRIQRGVSEQVDVGWQWPLSGVFGKAPDAVPGRALGPGQWYASGRINYSMSDRKVVDLVAGFEYDAGCWLGRVVLEHLQLSSTNANRRILFQLEFSGFSRLGAGSLQSLKAHVPKYQYLREEEVQPSRFQHYD